MFEGIKLWFEGSEEVFAALNNLFSVWQETCGVPVAARGLPPSSGQRAEIHQFGKVGGNQVAFINVTEKLPSLMIAFNGKKQRTELLNLFHI